LALLAGDSGGRVDRRGLGDGFQEMREVFVMSPSKTAGRAVASTRLGGRYRPAIPRPAASWIWWAVGGVMLLLAFLFYISL